MQSTTRIHKIGDKLTTISTNYDDALAYICDTSGLEPAQLDYVSAKYYGRNAFTFDKHYSYTWEIASL